MGGGLSDVVSIDRKKVYKLPPNMTTELGGRPSSQLLTTALCEPLAVAWHAVKLAEFKEGVPLCIVPYSRAISLDSGRRTNWSSGITLSQSLRCQDNPHQ